MIAAIELDALYCMAPVMAADNERALAGCAGHAFVRLGRASPYSRCAKCGGIADAPATAPQQAQEAAP